MKSTISLSKKANLLRKKILKMAFEGNGIHLSSSLSIVDILAVLYWKQLRFSRNPTKNGGDKFILSKGHGASALYAVLAQKGIILGSQLSTYGKEGAYLGAHPEHLVKGVELSTGSLGHGLSVGAGMALSAKIDGRDSKVFVLLSDGECQEGSVWEAAIFARQHKLGNLVAIIDYNKLQAFGSIKKIGDLEPFMFKWQSFGWSVLEVDGHDLNQLERVFKAASLSKNKPVAIIAHTTPGKGISFFENKLEWHYLNLDEELYTKALKELT